MAKNEFRWKGRTVMKLVLVSALPPPAGGLQTWTKRYMEYSIEDGSLNVSLVNTALHGSRRAKHNARTNLMDEAVRTRRILRDMQKRLDEGKPDLVHINTSCGRFGIFRDVLCVRMAKKRNIPVVLHFHCNIEDWVHGKARMWALKEMAGMADQALVLNEASQSFVSPFARKNPIIVPNFIDRDYLEAAHEIRDSIKKTVFVGHVQYSKGCREILEAAERFSDIQFFLIGPVADEMRSLPCPSNVSMQGPEEPDEVKRALLGADLFLFPSYSEGFSIALTEAMATGLPAIATDAGANRDMLEDRGGIIIPARDANAIAEAIRLLSEPRKRREMSAWSIKKVKENYTTDVVIARLTNLYRTLYSG